MIALVFVGQTGSGKTALATAVADALNLSRISSGDIARDLAERDLYARAGLERGEMAPELAMRAEVQMRIESAVARTGDFVIEGFPRMLSQLYILESLPAIRPLYFVLNVDPMACLRRLVVRQREDDHPDAVATRFQFYQEHTIPMLDCLMRVAIDLDGSLPTDTLTEWVVEEYQMERRRA